MTEGKANRVLTLGIGSEIQKDVGIPSRLIHDLSMHSHYESMDFESVYLGGLDLLEHIKEYKAVIFIDTIITENRVPGRVHYFAMEDYRETLHLSNRHDLSFGMTLQLGKRLGFSLPSSMHIIAVEITEDLEIGSGLSEEINDRYPGIRSEVVKCVDRLVNEISTEI